MKEISELTTKITFLLDEINVLGSQSNVAMALQQFHQVDMLQYERKEKEVFTPYPPIIQITHMLERIEDEWRPSRIPIKATSM